MGRVKEKSSPLLPQDSATDAALFFVVCALCFLAALTALAARSAYAAADAWVETVSGETTIRLSGDEADAEAAISILSATEGVLEAKRVSREEAGALLSPWLGAEGLPEDIPFPMIFSARLDPPRAPEIAARLASSLRENGLEASIDEHGAWSSDVRAAIEAAGVIALGALGLITAIAVGVIAFATHAALMIRRDVIDVLHLTGAEDRFISGVMERRFLLLGLRAGALGALLALSAIAFLIFLARSGASGLWLLPQLALAGEDAIILLATPVGAGIAAMISARTTVRRTLAGRG